MSNPMQDLNGMHHFAKQEGPTWSGSGMSPETNSKQLQKIGYNQVKYRSTSTVQ